MQVDLLLPLEDLSRVDLFGYFSTDIILPVKQIKQNNNDVILPVWVNTQRSATEKGMLAK